MVRIPQVLLEYHALSNPLVCEIDVEPWGCEFWRLSEIEQFNAEYGVSDLAPGYVGFATSGGGEMYALSPSGSVVCLAFIGMSPQETLPVAGSWQEFAAMLRQAV